MGDGRIETALQNFFEGTASDGGRQGIYLGSSTLSSRKRPATDGKSRAGLGMCQRLPALRPLSICPEGYPAGPILSPPGPHNLNALSPARLPAVFQADKSGRRSVRRACRRQSTRARSCKHESRRPDQGALQRPRQERARGGGRSGTRSPVAALSQAPRRSALRRVRGGQELPSHRGCVARASFCQSSFFQSLARPALCRRSRRKSLSRRRPESGGPRPLWNASPGS